MLNVVETLRELVAIPSVNPMGRPTPGSELAEAKLTEYLERLFRRLKIPVVRQPVEPGRDNIVARIDGPGGPRQATAVILFGAHQDTVPATGMTIPPWTPEVREGRLYGRGSCDVKGGMAAMLAALARLHEERPKGMPTVVMVCTVNEELGFSGANALPKLWQGHSRDVLTRRPDCAVVAEPTELQVVVVHKGLVRWRCHAHGRAAHSSTPEKGENAIYRLGRALIVIQRYAEQVVGTLGSHPLCGPATLNVGTITGGVSVNTVPDRCTIEIDRRLVPGEKPQSARQHVIDYLEREAGPDCRLEHEPPFMVGLPLSDEHNRPVADRLVAAATKLDLPCRTIGVPYGTDAASFAAAGVPTVVFGPGALAQAHTADEWIALEQVEKAAEVYYRFVKSFC